ncbi:MAG: glutaminase A, partial [Bacteroidales bacterium]|nr:glutaminase A [Bacteroidales bacterium]
MDYQKIFDDIWEEIRPFSEKGKQADYIPALAKVNPDQFGMCLQTVSGDVYPYRQADTRFSIQSISKVFALAMCLSLRGESLWKRIGKEPSGTAFNSLIQLEVEKGIPRNPFINAGAIVLSDILITELVRPEEEFLHFVRELCGTESIVYNDEVAHSEREHGFLNAAIANMLKSHGTIENDIEHVLMFYFKMCSVEMNCRELASAFMAFADRRPFDIAGYKLTTSQIKRLNAVMQTCGFYD